MLKKFLFTFAFILIFVNVFSFVVFNNGYFFYVQDIWYFSIGVLNDKPVVGFNIPVHNEVITVTTQKFFFKEVKVKLKTKDEFFKFRFMYYDSPLVIAQYKVKNIVPFKSESFWISSVGDFPLYFSDSLSNVKILGYSLLSLNTKYNGSGYSFNLFGYKNFHFGYFGAGGTFYGLGGSSGNWYGLFGVGLHNWAPAVGLTLVNFGSWGILGFGLELNKDDLSGHFYLRKNLGTYRFVVVFTKNGLILSVHE